jgi:hypothetical protein
MKNVILAAGVIIALVAGLLGGVFADFSDSETEAGDVLQAGSMDLKVDGMDDPDLLPAAIRGMIPDKSYHFEKVVTNDGTIDGWLYIHVKNVVCEETDDKGFKPEPEIVAEQGGQHGMYIVPGVGERCDMQTHIEVEILYDDVPVDLSAYDLNQDGMITLDEVECQQMLVAQLMACGEPHMFRFGFILHDVPEEFYGLDIFDETNEHEIKWNWWPTNAYQGDTVTFDIMFELLQTDYVPPGS